ncbi:MAG: rod-binding protein [Alphaproteobacteria bacterium]|nr:rod-binding protein [Alphaproteobacteria bacterium]
MADFITQATSSYYDNRQAPDVGKQQSTKETRKVAEQFEAFFLSQTMEQMHSGIETDGMFGGGHAEKVFRSMLFDEYGKLTAKTGGIGIADTIMRSMIQTQEVVSQKGEKE